MTASPRANRVLGILGGAFVFLLSAPAAVLMFTQTTLQDLRRFAVYRETPCTIVSFKPVTRPAKIGWRPTVEYEYRVDGTPYTSYSYDGYDEHDWWSAEAVWELAKDHPVGATSRCWIDPMRPRQAVLRRSIGWSYLFGSIVLALVAAGCVWFCVATLRPARTE